MIYMLLESGTGQFTLISTRLFDNYQAAVEYWANRQFKYALKSLEFKPSLSEQERILSYSNWGTLYEAKPGEIPKRVKQFREDIYYALEQRFHSGVKSN